MDGDETKARTQQNKASHEGETLAPRSDASDSPGTFIGDDDLLARSPETSFPVKDWDRYQFISFLGEGGMGRVYKAFDPALKRFVALKFIRGDDPELTQRFLNEAQAQARVEHENVCKIYEVGEASGRPYIAMQYIEGSPFQDLYGDLGLEQKVKIMQQVSEGLNAAHKIGLIHRDIKPGNIMVQRTEDGMLKPYLMDFGLAREAEAKGMTMTGMIVGTPAYMSPEQALGNIHQLTRRSDVYSLGASFYEALCGHPPFEADSTVALLYMVLEKEPVSMRGIDASIPRDIDTVVLKCLEKEPDRRYDSARAFAEDLQRYLDGEPVQAQQASVLYRLQKRARKHKPLVVVVSVALFLLLVLGAFSLRSQWHAREQTRIAQRFGQKVKEMETIMRFASYMQPLHDVRREREIVRKDISDIRSEMEKLGEAGRAPGNYAIGRGYFALEEFDSARKSLEEAWNDGYQEPEVAYALGLVLGRLYQHELLKLSLLSHQEREQRRKELETTLRDPALNFLRKGEQMETEAPEYARALIAFYQKQWSEAIQNADISFKKIPWLYEAKILKGDSLVSLGVESRIRGDHAEARQDFEKALQSFHEGINLARSDPEAYTDLCTLWDEVIEVVNEEGASPEQPMKEATSACESAIQADPGDYLPYLKLSDAYWRLAEYQSERGADGGPTLDKAVDAAQRSLRITPSSYAHDNIGIILMIRSQDRKQLGDDPRPVLAESIRNFQQGLKLNPEFTSSYNNMAEAYGALGDYQIQIGEDPRQNFAKAAELYEQFATRDPGQAYAGNQNLSWLYNREAAYDLMVGLDPSEALTRSIESAKKALAENSQLTDAYLNEASAWILKGEKELRDGSLSDDAVKQALQSLQQAEKINRETPELYEIRARLSLLQARSRAHKNDDPRTDFERAREQIRQAMNFSDGSGQLQQDLAEAAVQHAEWMISKKQNPSTVIHEGLIACQAAAKSKTDTPRTLALEGKLYILLGKSTGKQEALSNGTALLHQALKLNANLQRDLKPYLSSQ